MWHKPGNRVAGNDGIRIDANENFFVTQMLESKIQRIGFAGIGLSQNKNLAPDFFAWKRGAYNLQRIVLRSIINNDQSQIWIFLRLPRSPTSLKDFLFVFRRN